MNLDDTLLDSRVDSYCSLVPLDKIIRGKYYMLVCNSLAMPIAFSNYFIRFQEVQVTYLGTIDKVIMVPSTNKSKLIQEPTEGYGRHWGLRCIV